jgi:hypothetical protein
MNRCPLSVPPVDEGAQPLLLACSGYEVGKDAETLPKRLLWGTEAQKLDDDAKGPV